MNLPGEYDFINFHDHGSLYSEGVFTIDNIMVHEGREPSRNEGITFSVGAHPWFLNDDNFDRLLLKVKDFSTHLNVAAIGETGFDKLKGPLPEMQMKAFEIHAEIAEKRGKPLIIHCVKAWEEIIQAKKRINPDVPWIIHGFKGKKDLALQLTDKGFYLSAWVEWAIRPVSSETLNAIPFDRLFLETDGFDIDIEPVYKVVASYLKISVEQLKKRTYQNFMKVFSA